MNPESQIPHPSPESGSGCGDSPQSVLQQSGCGVSPQSVQGASRSESISPSPQPRIHPHPAYDDMGFVDPPEIPAESSYDGDFDYEDQARERELLMDDLADDNDDFARSEEDGWYYSDGD